MFSFRPWSEKDSDAFPFKVTFTDKYGDSRTVYVVSYIEDSAVIALLTRGLVKYDFTIEALPDVSCIPSGYNNSLNQYVGLLRRMYAYTKKNVTRKKIVTYTEVVTEEY